MKDRLRAKVLFAMSGLGVQGLGFRDCGCGFSGFGVSNLDWGVGDGRRGRLGQSGSEIRGLFANYCQRAEPLVTLATPRLGGFSTVGAGGGGV